jgi:Glycosyl transferase family 90
MNAVPCCAMPGGTVCNVNLLRSCGFEDAAAISSLLQVTLKHVSHYWMFYEAALKPWVHYVPVGQYDARDILPVRSDCHPEMLFQP